LTQTVLHLHNGAQKHFTTAIRQAIVGLNLQIIGKRHNDSRSNATAYTMTMTFHNHQYPIHPQTNCQVSYTLNLRHWLYSH